MDDLEKAARALCNVDREHPDEMVANREAEHRLSYGKGTSVRPVHAPRWTLKVQEATRILAVLNAGTVSLEDLNPQRD